MGKYNQSSTHRKVIKQLQPGIEIYLAHDGVVCKPSCTIQNIVYTLNLEMSDKQYRQQHQSDGTVVVKCMDFKTFERTKR